MSGQATLASLLTEEELALQDSVRRFMRNEVQPRCAAMEGAGEPPRDLILKIDRKSVV